MPAMCIVCVYVVNESVTKLSPIIIIYIIIQVAES